MNKMSTAQYLKLTNLLSRKHILIQLSDQKYQEAL